MLWLQTSKDASGTMNLGGSLTKQVCYSLASPLKKVKVAHHSIAECRVPELIPVLGSGSQAAGDVSHKPGGRLPLLSARPAVTHATPKRAATNFAVW